RTVMCCCSKPRVPRAWREFLRFCAAAKMDGRISVRRLRMEANALLPQSMVAGMVGRDLVGRCALAAAAVPLYHLPQWLRGAHSASAQLVAGGASDRLA